MRTALLLPFLALLACGSATEPTPAACSVEIVNDEFGPEVWMTREEDHEADGRATQIRLINAEYSATTPWMVWDFEYDGDSLTRIVVMNDEYSATDPWQTATYTDVPASSTAGCPTDFALPGMP